MHQKELERAVGAKQKSAHPKLTVLNLALNNE